MEDPQKRHAVLHTEGCTQIRHEVPSPGRETVGAAGVRTPSAVAPLTVKEQLGWPRVDILYVFHTRGKATAPSSSCWPSKIGETLLTSYFLSHPHVLPRLVTQPQQIHYCPTTHIHSLPSFLSLLYSFVFSLVCSLSPQGREGVPSSSLSLTFSASPLNLGGKVTMPLS